ncbi:hypothetical protein [Bacillus sp. UMB0893]|uniref:hypothetical protein n=1 Tax=Bacillus sp. UMB0893 TaxID=2066053 RepID=UPI0008A969F8|nr:hypothetical protein [Bacillus sp. UMB0893]OHR69509.1 hypothetical protein HMPREF3291_00530 [Bacillus sp. HMSC76G11]PLR65636.1 hypothetical protein CYJ36_22570 [Bacillus sp. UMB0893]
MDGNGFFIGGIRNFKPVVLPSHEENNRNAFVVGKIGRGRKFGMRALMYTMIEESIKNGERVLFIDPKMERGK